MTGIGKIFLGIALISLLAFGTFGMLNMSMDMQVDGTMGHCPFSVGDSICTMIPLAHIQASQSFFATLVSYGDTLIILALLAFSICAFYVLFKSHAPPLALAYIARRRRPVAFSCLQVAFSSGILNPKIF